MDIGTGSGYFTTCLAIMVCCEQTIEWLDMDKQLDYMDRQLDYMDRQLDLMDRQLDYMDRQLDYMDRQLDYIDRKLIIWIDRFMDT